MANPDRPDRRIPVAVVSAAALAAAGVGAYVISDDNGSPRDAAPQTTSSSAPVDTIETSASLSIPLTSEANAGGPVPPTTARPVVTPATATSTTVDRTGAGIGNGKGEYAANRPMVAVSPAIARAGKPVEFELKRFAKRSRVVVSVIGSSGNVVLTLTVTTASDGTAKGRFSAPTRGLYSVVASTTSPAASASTRLTVS